MFQVFVLCSLVGDVFKVILVDLEGYWTLVCSVYSSNYKCSFLLTVLVYFGGLERCVCKDFLGKLFGGFWDDFKMVLGWF